MLKYTKIIISLLLCAVLFSSCQSDRHLKDMLIAEGLAVDASDGGVTVSVQTLNVGMSSSSETPQGNMTVNTEASGKSISSALSSMNNQLSKRLFFGQNKLVVIGNELAKDGLDSYIDYFLRSDDARSDVLVCVSNQSAKYILESKENDASVPCESILYLVGNNEKTAQSIIVNSNDLLNLYKDQTSDIYLPVLSRKDDDSTVQTGSVALFCEQKLAHITDADETAGFVLLQNKAETVSLSFTDKELGDVTVSLSDIKCRKKASVSGSVVTLNVNISGKITLDELQNGAKSKLTAEAYNRITSSARERVISLCNSAFYACRSAKSDCLRLGEYLAKDSPSDYAVMKNDWKKYFASSLISVFADIKLQKVSDNSRLQ